MSEALETIYDHALEVFLILDGDHSAYAVSRWQAILAGVGVIDVSEAALISSERFLSFWNAGGLSHEVHNYFLNNIVPTGFVIRKVDDK